MSTVDCCIPLGVDLSHNKLGDRTAIKLAKVIERHGVLTSVNLANNRIGEIGARELADVISVNAVIRNLNLRLNFIGDEGTLRARLYCPVV